MYTRLYGPFAIQGEKCSQKRCEAQFYLAINSCNLSRKLCQKSSCDSKAYQWLRKSKKGEDKLQIRVGSELITQSEHTKLLGDKIEETQK